MLAVMPSSKMVEARELQEGVKKCPETCLSDKQCVDANCGFRCLKLSPTNKKCSEIWIILLNKFPTIVDPVIGSTK